jgi:hypothetical protein
MRTMNDLMSDIEDCYESGLTATETAHRLGVDVSIVAKTYRDLQEEFYIEQENRSYIDRYVSRYSSRAETGCDWD